MMKKILIIFASLVVFMGGFIFDLFACPTGLVCPRGGVCALTSECVNPNTVESLDLTRDQLGLTVNPGGPQGSKPSVTSHDPAQGDDVKPSDVVTKSVDANDANDKPLTSLGKNKVSTIIPQTPGQYIQVMRSVMQMHEGMERDRQAREAHANLEAQWTQESGCDKANKRLKDTGKKWSETLHQYGDAQYQVDKVLTDLNKAEKDYQLTKKIYENHPDKIAKQVRVGDAKAKVDALTDQYNDTVKKTNVNRLQQDFNEAKAEFQEAHRESSAAEKHYNQLEANYYDAQEASLPPR